jgi:tryptophan synthase alpha chain
MAKELKEYCDGIIIGSSIVKKVDETENTEEMLENVKKFISEVKEAL